MEDKRKVKTLGFKFKWSSSEAEVGFLSAILQDGPKNVKFLEKADPEWFFDLWHREIYLAMCSLDLAGVQVEEVERLGALLAETVKPAYESHNGLQGLIQLMAESASGIAETWFNTLADLYQKNLLFHEMETGGDWKSRVAVANLSFRERKKNEKPKIEFITPSQCRDYEIPPGAVLVGDNHLLRGGISVLGGAPGVGKSRALSGLVVAGLTGGQWFGLDVHHPLRMMVVQNENGKIRLKSEFSDINVAGFDDHLLISPPPDAGMEFGDDDFCDQIRGHIDNFKPDVFCIDPWSNLTENDKQKDYAIAFKSLQNCLPTGDGAPTLLISAHTKKPQTSERAHGRSLLSLLIGSFLLGSKPRSAFVMQAASDDPEDDRIVWTNCKNNDGLMPKATAWHRRNGLFARCDDFDWHEWNNPERAPGGRPSKVTSKGVAGVIGSGRAVKSKNLRESIMDEFSVAERTAKQAIASALSDGFIEKEAEGFYRCRNGAETVIAQ